MAIGTPTSIGSASTAVAGLTLPLTVSAAVAAGQFVVVSASCGAATTVTCTFTDSKGNTYATDVTANGRANGLCYVGSAQITTPLTTSDTITATFSNTVSAKLICAVQVSGIATSAAKDQTKIANGTVVGWSTGASAATTQADELVITACGNDSSATETSTPGAGYTELFDFANTTAAELTVAYQIVSATGAQTGSGTWTNSGSRGWNAALVTYKAAAGGGTTQALAGTSAGTSTDTGALDVAHSLAATDAGTSATTGAVNVAHTLAGTSAGTSASTGDLAVAHPLAGTSAGTSASSGDLVVAHSLAGTSAGTSTDVGAVDVAHPLAGTSAGTSTSTGDLSLGGQHALAGTSAGTSTTTGGLTVAHTLAGTSAGTSTTTGDLTLAGQVPVAGTSAGSSTSTGGLTVAHTLTGTSAGTSTDTGALSVAGALTGTSTGTSTSTGAVTVERGLAGTSIGLSTSTGAVAVNHTLAGVSTGSSTTAGSLSGAAAPFTYGGDDDPAFAYDGGSGFTYGGDDTPGFSYGGD